MSHYVPDECHDPHRHDDHHRHDYHPPHDYKPPYDPRRLTLTGPGMTRLKQAYAVNRGRDLNPADLHVIVPYYNPHRWYSREVLHQNFMAWIEHSGATVYTVELTVGDMPFQVTEHDDLRHLQLQTDGAVPWIKENLVNLGFNKLLPPDAKYVAWMDGDVRLENPNWVTDTLHELQHAKVVQMFSEAVDVGPHFEVAYQENGWQDVIRTSIVKHYTEIGNPLEPTHEEKKNIHCGFAWAARRSFLSQLDPYDPLVDYSLIGSADWQMAWAFLGNSSYGLHGGVCDSYKRRITAFAHKCDKHLQGNVSYVPGLLRHHWHGHKSNRQYVARWDMLIKNGYDPDLDVTYRHDGLLVLTDRNSKLPLLFRAYGRSRNEDAV